MRRTVPKESPIKKKYPDKDSSRKDSSRKDASRSNSPRSNAPRSDSFRPSKDRDPAGKKEMISGEVLRPPRNNKLKKRSPLPAKEDAVRSLRNSITGGTEKNRTLKYPVRINRFLATCGLGSRRQVEDFVLKGRVSINGKKILNLDVRVEADDAVQFDGKTIRFDGSFIYLAMNKPVGYTVSKRRFKNDRTIYEMLPEDLQMLKYAGRLDRDSRGLLILSNDGNFIASITHPSKRITKRYLVQVDTIPPIQEIEKSFYRGIRDEDELLKAVSVRIMDREKKIIEVVLGEGKKRQLRRMFRAMNMKILDLYRVSVGFLNLEDLNIPQGKTVPFVPEQLVYDIKPDQKKDDELLGFDPWKK